jgi:hypothetical protein
MSLKHLFKSMNFAILFSFINKYKLKGSISIQKDKTDN